MTRTTARQSTEDIVQLPGFRSPRDPSRSLRAGGHHQSREHVAKVQRDRLIDAFVLVVAELGYEGAGIKTICRRAGVAFNTFYQYFSTKEELFLAAYDLGVGMLFERAAKAFEVDDVPWATRVEMALTTILTILAYNPAFACLAVVEANKVGPAGMDRVDQAFDASYAMFAGAKPIPGLLMETDDLMPLVIGGIHSRMASYIRAGQVERLADLGPSMAAFAVASFQTEPAPKKKGVAKIRPRAR